MSTGFPRSSPRRGSYLDSIAASIFVDLLYLPSQPIYIQIPIRLSVLVHTKVVPHLVGDHEHRLKVVSLVDRARVVRMAHSGDPRQPNHTGNVF